MENKTELMQLRHPDYDRELTELVRSNLSPKAFREKLLDYHENDIAAALEALTLSERQRIYHALDAAELSAVLEYAEPMTAYLNELSLRRRVNVLSRMDADAAVDYLKTLESGEKNTLVELMDEPKRREIARLWVYGEDEIGSIMTTNCIVIPEGLSVKAAMHQLVEQAAEHDNISTIYVVDSDNAFYGAIDLKDLIIAREGDPLAELIATSYPYVYAHERIEDALPRIQDYSEDSIPVLDEENRMLGVVTAQSLIQTVDDALSEDYARLAGLSAEEDLNETLVQSVRKRLPWLLVLLGLGMVVSSVVGLFESVVAQLTLIVCFQSLVLDMAGNVGTQSLAVTIRVLMDSETTSAQKRKLVWKEARRTYERRDPRRGLVRAHRGISSAARRSGAHGVRRFGLHRHRAHRGDAALEHFRHGDPDLLQKDRRRSRRRLRPAHHDRQRPRRSRIILRPHLAAAHRMAPSGIKRFLPGSGEHSPEPGRKRSLFKAIYFAERSACIFFPR